MDELKRKAVEKLNFIETNAQAEINSAYNFLNEAGANTHSINIDFENTTFILSGTVETGEELSQLNEILANSGSERPIENTVTLEDFTAKNILLRVVTKGSNLNIRGGAGTNNSIVGKFANGIEVTLIKKIKIDWYLVRSNDIEGYCHTNFLKPVENTTGN